MLACVCTHSLLDDPRPSAETCYVCWWRSRACLGELLKQTYSSNMFLYIVVYGRMHPFNNSFCCLSPSGQGQGPRAEQMMKSAMERGKWVFFQNCHLAPSWMPSLERLIEQIDGDKVSRQRTITDISAGPKSLPCLFMFTSV